jgi:hypothetical protein
MLLLRGFKGVRYDSSDASHVSGVKTCSHLLKMSRKGRERTESTNCLHPQQLRKN